MCPWRRIPPDPPAEPPDDWCRPPPDLSGATKLKPEGKKKLLAAEIDSLRAENAALRAAQTPID